MLQPSAPPSPAASPIAADSEADAATREQEVARWQQDLARAQALLSDVVLEKLAQPGCEVEARLQGEMETARTSGSIRVVQGLGAASASAGEDPPPPSLLTASVTAYP